MNSRYAAWAAIAAITATGGPAVQAQTAATLSMDLNQKKSSVSPSLYGLMTEEINYSYDGGLYAELVRNRTFRTSRGPNLEHWTLIQNGNAQASIAIDR